MTLDTTLSFGCWHLVENHSGEQRGFVDYLSLIVSLERHLPETAAAHAFKTLRSYGSSTITYREREIVIVSDHNRLFRPPAPLKL